MDVMNRESTLALPQRLITSVLRRVDVVAALLDPIREEPSISGIEPLEPGSLDAYLAFRPHASRDVVEDRFRRGQRCYALWTQVGIVSVCWAATGPIHLDYLKAMLYLAPGDVYMFDAYTAPAYRGQSLAAHVYRRITWDSARQGIRRSLGLLAVENHAGRQVVLKLGWRVIGRYTLVRAGPLRHWTQSPSPGESALPWLRPQP